MEASKIPSTPEIKLHFLDYWRIIRLRKTIIFSVFLLVVLTAAVVSLKLEKKYMSVAQMTVEKSKPDIAELDRGSYSYSGFDPYFISTEFERIRSTSILFPVITNLDLQNKWGRRSGNDNIPLTVEEAYRVLGSIVDVQQTRNTSMIEIQVISADKDEAMKIANEIARVYKDSRLQKHKKLSAGGLQELEKQLQAQQEKVLAHTVEVDKLRQELKIIDFDGNNPIISSMEPQKLMRLTFLAVEEKQELTKLEELYNTLSKLPKNELRYAIPPNYRDASLTEALLAYNSWELELKKLENDLQGEQPKLVEAKNRVADLDKQIDRAVAGILTAIKTQLNASQRSYNLTMEDMEKERAKDLERVSKQTPYETAKLKLKDARDFLSFLEFRYQTESADSRLPMDSVVEITTNARAADRAHRPNIPLNIVLGAIVGLMVGVGLAFFIEYLDTSVKTIDDVERAVQAPVLAVIPQNVGNMMDEGPESPHAEAYRVLRTNILFSRKNDKLNSITVVSGGAGEGKTTTLFNLATVFAQTGDRVLLVDSDLRRPSLHKILGISNSLGLTNFLLKQNSLEEVIHRTNLPTLDILPSGKLPSSSMGILSSPQMKELMQELKGRYDFVFFDSPPIMGVSDASILASLMDITLQVIQYRRYPQQMTIRAKQVIEKVGGNLIGIVLNNISMGQDDNYYYYSGYYSDYYAKEDGEEKKQRRKSTKRAAELAKVEIKQKF